VRAIFAVDGGNATGLAWGIFDDKARSVEEAIQNRLHAGSATINRRVKRDRQTCYMAPDVREPLVERFIGQTPLEDMAQVIMVYLMFFKFKRHAVRVGRMDPDSVDLILEDFILLPGAHAGGKDGVASVRIAWGVAGYQEGVAAEYARRRKQLHISEPIWQAPSVMGRVKDHHLKSYGVWIPGRDHERAAWRHIAFRLNTLLK